MDIYTMLYASGDRQVWGLLLLVAYLILFYEAIGLALAPGVPGWSHIPGLIVRSAVTSVKWICGLVVIGAVVVAIVGAVLMQWGAVATTLSILIIGASIGLAADYALHA